MKRLAKRLPCLLLVKYLVQGENQVGCKLKLNIGSNQPLWLLKCKMVSPLWFTGCPPQRSMYQTGAFKFVVS